jgi:tRNA U54 and U55 pseudouridine synthase Pus10
MLTAKQKAEMLSRVVDLLNEADALQQQALGDCDVCWDNHERIQDIADDVVLDMIEFEGQAL